MTLYLFSIRQCPKNLEQRIVLALTTTIATTHCGIMGFGKASIITTSLVIHYNVTAATLHQVVKAQTNAYLLVLYCLFLSCRSYMIKDMSRRHYSKTFSIQN